MYREDCQRRFKEAYWLSSNKMDMVTQIQIIYAFQLGKEWIFSSSHDR